MKQKMPNKHFAGVFIVLTRVGDLRKVFFNGEYDYEGFFALTPAQSPSDGAPYLLPDGMVRLYRVFGLVKPGELLDIAVNKDIPDTAELPVPVTPIFSRRERADRFVRTAVSLGKAVDSDTEREAVYKMLVYEYSKYGYRVDLKSYFERVN